MKRSQVMRKYFESAQECLAVGNPAPLLLTIEEIIRWIEDQEQREGEMRK